MKKFLISFTLCGALFSQDAIEVTPAFLDFGNVLMGNSPTLTFTITCNLDQTITITPPSYYSVDTSEIEMVTGTTQDVVVTFTSPQVGNFDSQIVLAGSTFGNAIVAVNATVTNNLSGSMSGTLSSQFSPYEVSGDLIIESGNTWTIESGTELKFAFGKRLVVEGQIQVQGNYENLVHLTALDPDSGWAGIEFSETDGSVLEYLKLTNVTNDLNIESPFSIHENFEDGVQNFTDDPYGEIQTDALAGGRNILFRNVEEHYDTYPIIQIPPEVHNGENIEINIIFRAEMTEGANNSNFKFSLKRYGGNEVFFDCWTGDIENGSDKYRTITYNYGVQNNDDVLSIHVWATDYFGSTSVYIDEIGVRRSVEYGSMGGKVTFENQYSKLPGTFINPSNSYFETNHMLFVGNNVGSTYYYSPWFPVIENIEKALSFDIMKTDASGSTSFEIRVYDQSGNDEAIYITPSGQNVSKTNVTVPISSALEGNKYRFRFYNNRYYAERDFYVYLDNFILFGSNGPSAITYNNSNDQIIRNSIITNSMGGIKLSNSNAIIKNCVLFNNDYAGLSTNQSSGTILNSIIWSNNIDLLNLANSEYSMDYSIYSSVIGDINLGSNNINQYPHFDLETFELDFLSPGIDAGHPNDYDDCMPPGLGSLSADIGMFGGMNNCGSSESNLGGGEPIISYIVDLPQDQGGLVGIQFENSFYDGGSNVYDITHYSFWRELDPDALDTNYFSIHPNGDYYRPNQRTGEYWEYIGESPAQGFDSYGYTATTLADSNHNGLFWSKYLVVAHTGDESVYFVSEPDSGYSVDNLNPDPVENLNMNFFGNYNQITWEIPTSEDYLYTKIIRDDEIVSEVYDNISFSDFDLEFSTHYLYRIVHVDENGNESETVERDVETPEWVVHLETQSDIDGVANSNFYFAAHDSATISFDAYYDILSPPPPPGDYLRLVSQQDFNNELTDYSYVSVDPVDLSSFTRSVNVAGISSGINAPDGVNDQVLINAYLHGLDGIDFNISIDYGGFFTPSTIDSNEVITKQFSMYFNDNDSTHLELVLGNQTLGQPTFANFNQVEIYHGAEQYVILNTSGIDNAMLKLEMFYPDGGSIIDTLGVYTNLNSALDTLSVDFFEYAEDDYHHLRKKGYIENAKLILDFTYSDYDYAIVSSEFSVLSDTITHIHNGEWDLVHPYFGDRQITDLIENATDLPYSAYVLNEENLSYEIVNFSDINTKSGTSFWLKVSAFNPDSTLELDLYGSSPELNSLQSKMIRNVPGWVMVGSSVRPVSRDSILVTVYESGVEMQLSWQQAVSDSIVVNRLYGLDGAGNYSSDSITNVTKGFWLGISDTSESTDSIKLEFPIHRITQDVVSNQLFDYGIILNGLAMGFSPDASNAQDSKDEVSPPRIPTNEPQVELFHPEWNFPLGDYFLSDVRHYPAADYEEFPIKFSNSGQIKLEPQLIDLPSEWGAALVFGGQQIDFFTLEEITINVQNNDVGVIILGDLEQLSIDLGNNLPSQYALHQNYPNPFNPTTTLRYDIPEDSHVSITIFDMLGNKVTNLVNDNQKSGFKSVKWNAINDKGESVSAGVYIYRIQAGGFSSTKKMILLK